MNRPTEPRTLARIREVFGSSPFQRLFATVVVSRFGDGIFQLASADLLLFREPGRNPALKLAIISVITIVPFSVLGPFVGVFIDRWDRRKILTYTPVVRAALAGLIGLGIGRNKQGFVFYLIVLVVLSANRLFLATISAVLPQTVPEDDLLVANSVASTGGSLAGVVGLGIGALLSSLIGGTAAAGIGAIAFLAGGALARRVPVRRGVPGEHATALASQIRVLIDELADGARRMATRPRVRYAMSGVALNQLLVGAVTAIAAVFFLRDLHLGVGAVSSLLGVLAVGIGVGIAIVPPLGERVRHDALIPLSFAIAAITMLAVGATLSRASVLVGSVVVGIAYAMTKIPVDTIVQEELPDSHRGRAFSVYDVLFNVSRLAGTAVVAGLIQIGVGARALVLSVGALYLAGTLALFVGERRLRTSLPSEQQGHAPVPQSRDDGIEELAGVSPETLFPTGEMVTVRSGAFANVDGSPEMIAIGGREIPIEGVIWRALEERKPGVRRHVFVVRAAGMQVRLASGDDSSRWEVESSQIARASELA